jgi:hypothetical protein
MLGSNGKFMKSGFTAEGQGYVPRYAARIVCWICLLQILALSCAHLSTKEKRNPRYTEPMRSSRIEFFETVNRWRSPFGHGCRSAVCDTAGTGRKSTDQGAMSQTTCMTDNETKFQYNNLYYCRKLLYRIHN